MMMDRRKLMKAVMLSPFFLLNGEKKAEASIQLVVKDCTFTQGLTIDGDFVKGIIKESVITEKE